MSHPTNKRERFLFGKRKSFKRVKLWVKLGNVCNTKEKMRNMLEKLAQQHRNTTKICGKRCCANPRKYEKQITLQEKKFVEAQKFID
jgi:hypothetical protein